MRRRTGAGRSQNASTGHLSLAERQSLPLKMKTSECYDSIAPPEEDIERLKNYTCGTATNRYFDDVLPIGEEEVREALLREAKKHRYWRASVVKKMQIESLEQSACQQYTLESFTEARSTVEATEAYMPGANINGTDAGGSGKHGMHNPWDYEVVPTNMFVEKVRVLEMPGTSVINGCANCASEGTTHCFHCRGMGTDKCNFCRGTGMKAGVAHPAVYTHPMIATFPHADLSRGYASSSTAMVKHGQAAYGVGTPMHFMSKTGVPPPGIGTHDLCYMCHGRGIKECQQCRGTGKKTCNKCGGSGSVRTYTKMKVYFNVEKTEYFTECDIPQNLLEKAEGKEIFSEDQPYVLPITKYCVKEINEASRKMCAAHLQKCIGTCRVIRQRHELIAIPIVKVNYSVDKTSGTFWVYGKERKCYVPKYPSRCTIL